MRERIRTAIAHGRKQTNAWTLSLGALFVLSVAVVFGVAGTMAPRPLPATTGIANPPAAPARVVGVPVMIDPSRTTQTK